MAKLVCVSCGAEAPVPTVCCGPGVKGSDPEKLYCPAGEDHGSSDTPQHCGEPMNLEQ